MPPRSERLLWLHGRSLDPSTTAEVDSANRALLGRWSDSGVHYYPTVSSEGKSDRLWLFRVSTGEQRTATRFNKLLKEHIDNLKPIKLKRQVNLPTPLIALPAGEGHKLDIGLHVVNDIWNGALMMFFYYEGRYYNPPHLQLPDMARFANEADGLWTAAACACHSARDCCTKGCWKCFQLDCSRCQGTGWKEFATWLDHGARIDYASGWPLALT